MLIKYNGREANLNFYEDISTEEREEMKKEFFNKPERSQVERQLDKLLNEGGKKLGDINKYYFFDLMCDTRISKAIWTVNEVFESNELAGSLKARMRRYTFKDVKEFSPRHMITIFYLFGIRFAKIPTQFPLKTIDEILAKYNVNGNYFDYSCGWGIRMLSAVKNDVNYYGTDPNYKLTEKLNELYNDCKKVKNVTTEVKIYTQGSEEFIPELENKIGLAFSSPPYFELEDYKYGNQSYTSETSYVDWLNNYWDKTVKNIHKYLIDDGYFIINIKDTKYPLEKDMTEIMANNGFEFVETLTLKNIKRNDKTDNSENIHVFKKKK